MKHTDTAVIFDLDGTLWDAADTIAPAWNEYLAQQGIPRRFTPDQCRGCCGKTLPQIAAMLYPDMEPAEAEALVNGCCDAECVPLSRKGGKLYPGLLEVLETLGREHLLAVVSNCGLGYVEAFFSGNRTEKYFDDYENAARTGLDKGDNIRLVMERNHIARALYVGDTQGDRDAARSAGIPFVHAAYGYGSVTDADAVIRTITELPNTVDMILCSEIRGCRDGR